MNEVNPWISDYFLNLATLHGSNFNTVPLTEKLRRCQLKKVLTSEPKDYFWVVLSDRQHEIPGRIPKEVAEGCLKDAQRDQRFTRHTGSVIDIRGFTPLFIRVEDGPSTSATRKVLALDIRKARLRGAAGEPIWGSPQSLDNVPELKEWLHELRKPDGNRDILKIRKKQQDEAKAVKQFTETPELSPDSGLHLQPATYAPAAALRKVASTSSTVGERLPMQRYRRKWHKAVPGLGEVVHRLQMPEDVRLKILEKRANKDVKAKPRSSGTVPTKRLSNTRGALEIGSSPARLSSVPRATTPEDWPASPGVLKRLYDNHETDMSSDVSSRPSSPVDAYHDAEMGEVKPQPEPEPETVPETPQVPVDSQSQHLSPPPPAQPPRPRSPLPSSSNPHMQNNPASPASIHTSIQAVTGSQLPSFENPPAWARSDGEPSGGPSFELPWTPRDPPVATPKPTPGTRPSPEKQTTLPSSVKEPALPVTSKHPQEKETVAKKISRVLPFGEFLGQAVAQAFQQGDSGEVVSTAHNPSTLLPTPKVTVAQLPPPKPRSKPPSKVTQKSLPRPSASPLDRLVETDHSEFLARQPFQALNRKVPVPEVGPTREATRGRNENGAPTMVLIPASDDTKLSSPLKQNSSSQPVQSSQSIPSSHSIPLSAHLPPSQVVPSSEPQIQHSTSQPDKSIAQDGDSIMVQVNETVADIEEIRDSAENTQSSLEYASTQDDDRVVVGAGPSTSVDKFAEAVVVTEKVADEPLASPLPQIAAIPEVESQQSAAVENEEVDELEDDSEPDDLRPMAKRKLKPASPKPASKTTKHQKPSEPARPAPSSRTPSKSASRVDSVVGKVPSRPSSKLPPKPIVLIERKRTPAVPTDERVSTAQKRRMSAPSEEGFPVPQPIKRSRIHGNRRPVQTTLSPIPRTPSPLPRAGRNSVVSSVSRSAKGKERAEGIKGLEKIAVKDVEREDSAVIKVAAKKNAPDTGSKRKPSDAFSAQDDSRDVKRQKVVIEPEPRKLGKQLSFVDPDKLKRPFRSKPQIHKTSAQYETTSTTTVRPSAVTEPDRDERTSKYFNPQLYREPGYPRMTTTFETEPPQKVAGPKLGVRSNGAAHENGHDSGGLQPWADSRKASTSGSDRHLPGKSRKFLHVLDDDGPPGRSAAASRVQRSKPVGKDVGRGLFATEPQHPPVRKLGSFAPNLNPPPLPGLPGGRLMNKQLREILIRTGKVRVREAKAAESNQNGR